MIGWPFPPSVSSKILVSIPDGLLPASSVKRLFGPILLPIFPASALPVISSDSRGPSTMALLVDPLILLQPQNHCLIQALPWYLPLILRKVCLHGPAEGVQVLEQHQTAADYGLPPSSSLHRYRCQNSGKSTHSLPPPIVYLSSPCPLR